MSAPAAADIALTGSVASKSCSASGAWYTGRSPCQVEYTSAPVSAIPAPAASTARACWASASMSPSITGIDAASIMIVLPRPVGDTAAEAFRFRR